ncbi:thioredoxin-like protein [Macrolepiota fuliginosa MF-IS2]|uniref:Thioredoxin-like protein n=1 Tax=Macrolepiota fuliginosa MF-IS2 TaxID=1400762 RepID=A0A9P5XKB0_9AGAR|nr:thioredoxin-like protein [Macrolepiota fuliginosa MF-IS2]
MAINPNEDTEFNDALRKHGILPPRPKTLPSPSPPTSPSLEERLDDLDDAELLELEEEAKDDEAERRIREYHEKRLEDQRKEVQRARFGRVYPIGRDDYTREVTEASKVDEPGDDKERGTGVVCFLYKDGIPRSDRTFQHVQTLAQKYPRTKFVSIVGDKCIPNLPDSRIPMLIVYRRGDIKNQITAWGADRERSPQELEAMLIMSGTIDPPERPPPGSRRDSDGESGDEDDDASSRMRSKVTRTNARTDKNIRSSGNDSDSDFEFDI